MFGPRQGCLAPAKDVDGPRQAEAKKDFKTLNPKKVYSGWPGVGWPRRAVRSADDERVGVQAFIDSPPDREREQPIT